MPSRRSSRSCIFMILPRFPKHFGAYAKVARLLRREVIDGCGRTMASRSSLRFKLTCTVQKFLECKLALASRNSYQCRKPLITYFSPSSPVSPVSALIFSSNMALLSALRLLIRRHVTVFSCSVILSQFAI